MSRRPGNCQFTPAESGAWVAKLSPFVRAYFGVASAIGYLDCLVETIGRPVQQPMLIHPSSLSLPEAIDYLNALWRVNVGKGVALFRISRAEAAASWHSTAPPSMNWSHV